MARIFIIDDDEQLLRMLRKALEIAGHEVAAAGNGKDGIKLFRENPADLILSDILMPEMDGLEVLMQLRREFPQVKIIAMSGGSESLNLDTLEIARRLGAVHTLRKPFALPEMLRAVREVLDPSFEK